jgi:hypothetical protein
MDQMVLVVQIDGAIAHFVGSWAVEVRSAMRERVERERLVAHLFDAQVILMAGRFCLWLEGG